MLWDLEASDCWVLNLTLVLLKLKLLWHTECNLKWWYLMMHTHTLCPFEAPQSLWSLTSVLVLSAVFFFYPAWLFFLSLPSGLISLCLLLKSDFTGRFTEHWSQRPVTKVKTEIRKIAYLHVPCLYTMSTGPVAFSSILNWQGQVAQSNSHWYWKRSS